MRQALTAVEPVTSGHDSNETPVEQESKGYCCDSDRLNNLVDAILEMITPDSTDDDAQHISQETVRAFMLSLLPDTSCRDSDAYEAIIMLLKMRLSENSLDSTKQTLLADLCHLCDINRLEVTGLFDDIQCVSTVKYLLSMPDDRPGQPTSIILFKRNITFINGLLKYFDYSLRLIHGGFWSLEYLLQGNDFSESLQTRFNRVVCSYAQHHKSELLKTIDSLDQYAFLMGYLPGDEFMLLEHLQAQVTIWSSVTEAQLCHFICLVYEHYFDARCVDDEQMLQLQTSCLLLLEGGGVDIGKFYAAIQYKFDHDTVDHRQHTAFCLTLYLRHCRTRNIFRLADIKSCLHGGIHSMVSNLARKKLFPVKLVCQELLHVYKACQGFDADDFDEVTHILLKGVAVQALLYINPETVEYDLVCLCIDELYSRGFLPGSYSDQELDQFFDVVKSFANKLDRLEQFSQLISRLAAYIKAANIRSYAGDRCLRFYLQLVFQIIADHENSNQAKTLLLNNRGLIQIFIRTTGGLDSSLAYIAETVGLDLYQQLVLAWNDLGFLGVSAVVCALFSAISHDAGRGSDRVIAMVGCLDTFIAKIMAQDIPALKRESIQELIQIYTDLCDLADGQAQSDFLKKFHVIVHQLLISLSHRQRMTFVNIQLFSYQTQGVGCSKNFTSRIHDYPLLDPHGCFLALLAPEQRVNLSIYHYRAQDKILAYGLMRMLGLLPMYREVLSPSKEQLMRLNEGVEDCTDTLAYFIFDHQYPIDGARLTVSSINAVLNQLNAADADCLVLIVLRYIAMIDVNMARMCLKHSIIQKTMMDSDNGLLNRYIIRHICQLPSNVSDDYHHILSFDFNFHLPEESSPESFVYQWLDRLTGVDLNRALSRFSGCGHEFWRCVFYTPNVSVKDRNQLFLRLVSFAYQHRDMFADDAWLQLIQQMTLAFIFIIDEDSREVNDQAISFIMTPELFKKTAAFLSDDTCAEIYSVLFSLPELVAEISPNQIPEAGDDELNNAFTLVFDQGRFRRLVSILNSFPKLGSKLMANRNFTAAAIAHFDFIHWGKLFSLCPDAINFPTVKDHLRLEVQSAAALNMLLGHYNRHSIDIIKGLSFVDRVVQQRVIDAAFEHVTTDSDALIMLALQIRLWNCRPLDFSGHSIDRCVARLLNQASVLGAALHQNVLSVCVGDALAYNNMLRIFSTNFESQRSDYRALVQSSRSMSGVPLTGLPVSRCFPEATAGTYMQVLMQLVNFTDPERTFVAVINFIIVKLVAMSTLKRSVAVQDSSDEDKGVEGHVVVTEVDSVPSVVNT